MAIVKMQRLSMVALKDDREKILKRMQQLQCVEVMECEVPEGGEPAPYEVSGELAEQDAHLLRLRNCITSLTRRDKQKKSLFAQRPMIETQQAEEAVQGIQEALQQCEQVADQEGRIADARQQNVRALAQIEQLVPLLGLNVPFGEVGDTAHTSTLLGVVPQSGLDLIHSADCPQLYVQEVGREAESVYVLSIYHKSVAEEAIGLLSQAGLTRLSFPYEGTAAEAIKELKAGIKQADERAQEAEEAIEAMVGERAHMELLCDLTVLKRDRLVAASQMQATQRVLCLEGWIPVTRMEILCEAMADVSPSAVLNFSDPQEGERVPTCLQNGKIVTPYESVVNMFSPASQNDVDPTPRMMPFFALFFGMMVSDAAYGIILTALGIVGAYVIKMRGMLGDICKTLIFGGLCTIFWGVLFGSWFGIEGLPVPFISPLGQPIEMLALCCGLGLVHIFVGMIIKANMAWRAGDWQTAVFDQYSWMLMILSLLGMALSGTGLIGSIIPSLEAASGTIFNVCVGIVLVCLAAILLFAKRDQKWGIGRIIGGLASLYDISSYLSDILSYARLFAMGLATGVICMVFNTIAGMLMGGPIGAFFGVLILIVGHTFNLGINSLGAFVHSCRLQYIEYFGKFYEGGGREFKPLMRKLKYTDLRNEN